MACRCEGGCLEACQVPSVGAVSEKRDIACLCLQVGYSLEVRGSGASDSVTGQGAFHPSKLIGWGISHLESGSRPIAWDEFWADGSPWLARDGVARVRFTLQAPA